MKWLPSDEVRHYGFEWGPAHIIRACETRNGFTLIIATDYGKMDVFISRGGRMIRSFFEKDAKPSTPSGQQGESKG